MAKTTESKRQRATWPGDPVDEVARRHERELEQVELEKKRRAAEAAAQQAPSKE
jgi:hypothetical protein